MKPVARSIIISIPIGLLILLFLGNQLSTLFLTRAKIRSIVNEHSLLLSKDFEVVSKQVSGTLDLAYDIRLIIDTIDKFRIIQLIRNDPSYLQNAPEIYDIRKGIPRHTVRETLYAQALETEFHYEIQYYQPNQKGYKPKWD